MSDLIFEPEGVLSFQKGFDERFFWVVGKVTNIDNGAWELQGIFSSEERALAAAVGKHDFIGKVQLDRELPRRTVAWPEAWYPNIEDKPT